MLALLKAFALLAPVVKDLVVAIVKEINKAPNPEHAARRALAETQRVRAMDNFMRSRGEK